jgi:tRNA-2-methylthio-N6-dimethylallyladenosine synthase
LKYLFETYGCQMNIAESAALVMAGRELGWEETTDTGEADLVLLNTCSVRATAEQRVYGRLAHYAALKKKRSFTLVVAGCMAQRFGEKLKDKYPAVDHVMGTSARARFPLILEAVGQGRAYVESNEKPQFSFSAFHHNQAESPYRGFVPIMHGCDNFCSYCVVPYLRGPEVSRDPAAILQEIRLVGERGVREVTLLGQNVNSYLWEDGKSGKLDFPGLLELIASNLTGEGVRWVRFLSSHPKDLSPKAIRVLAANPVFCRHIHLCVQHGSNRILDAMNRRYTREQYLDLVGQLRSALPGSSLSTDILVGFPGETDEDLEAVLSLMEEVKFLYAYMYHYNPREGTAAYNLPGRIDEDVKRRRLSRVIALQKRHTTGLLKSRVGAEATVLIEGISRKNADELISRTERDEMVVVPASSGSLGSFVTVTLSSLRGNTFRSTK